jgi:ribosomal protein S18 acetylase RimI-like enzyme
MDIFERKIIPASAPIELPEGLEITLLQTGEVDEFVEFRALHDRKTILQRLERGQTCFLARHHGQIIHNAWIVKGRTRIDYLACDIQLAGDTIYVFETYTSNAWRGRSISSMRVAVMEKYCQGQGYLRLLAVVWPESKPANRNVEKAGYQRVGRIGYLGAGRFRKYFCRYEKNDPSFQLTEKPDGRTSAYGERYWDSVPWCIDAQSHYLDSFLAQVKRRENLRLVVEWGDVSPDSRLLKTDAFEEAMGEDSFLTDLV